MKNENLKKMTKGFTLAETLITLTILGVVAAITVPMLINKQMEAANRTKLKKAMAAYEKALNQMIVDNDIKGTITAVEGFRLTDNCSGSRPYFKAIKEIAGNNCRFQTADKVWWDITDIEHPVISLKDQLTDAMVTGVKTTSDDYKDDKTLFLMTGEITNGILRVNDQADTGLSDEAKANLDKIYAFIDVKGKTEKENIAGTPLSEDDAQYVPNKYKNLPYCSDTITSNCVNIEKNPYDDPNGIIVCVRSTIYNLNNNYCDYEYYRYQIPAAGADVDYNQIREIDGNGNIYTLSEEGIRCEDEKYGANDSPCKALGYTNYSIVGYYTKPE